VPMRGDFPTRSFARSRDRGEQLPQETVERELLSPGDRVLRPSSRPRGVPVAGGPHDWGLFGPDSVSWRVHSSPVLLVGGLRALIIQHMRRMAGIDRNRLIYLGARAGTRTAGAVMRVRIFDRMGASLVGRRTVTLPRQARGAAKHYA
jgi:uncharacterized protein (DUF2236 family)